MLESIQVLKHALFLPGPLLTLLSSGWVMITPLWTHNTQTSHMHTNTPQPWSKPQMAINRLLWAGLDESVSLDSLFFFFFGFFLPSGRLLVYFSTHHHLYVPSLSFCSDKEQTRAIDHVRGKMNYSAAGAPLDAKFERILKFDTVAVELKVYHTLYRSWCSGPANSLTH